MKRDSKAAMVRLAIVGGGIVIDAAATAPGRGGYLHPTRECLDRFAKFRSKEYRSLKRVVNRDEKLPLINCLRMRLDSQARVA
jgi:predicted RNA-binding protein YlxR (DUF448 family)